MSDSGAQLDPLRGRLIAVARAAGKPQWVIEKDWALSYLLLGLASVTDLRDELVFKGGTCLRKSYFPGYRFSEDLDFTLRSPATCEALLMPIQEAASTTRASFTEFGPFQLDVRHEQHREVHPRGQCSFSVHIQFPWMPPPLVRLKIEITSNEPILHPVANRPLIHEFDAEIIGGSMPCYSLEEIASEKLRALLQSRKHLADKGWVANRPRDVYDLAHLHRQSTYAIEWNDVARLLKPKAAAYAIEFDAPADFLDEEVWLGIERDWEPRLADFVPDHRSFDDCAASVREILRDLPMP